MASITLPRPSRKGNPANGVDLKTCLTKGVPTKGKAENKEGASVLRPVHGEARIRRSSPTQVWWTEAAAAACTRQPIETRYNWRLSERGKKDLFGTNLILTPNKPILVFPPRDQTRKSTEELTRLAILFIQLSLQHLLVRFR